MKRPDMKPVWSSLIIVGRQDFNLFATMAEKNLYIELSKVKGRQFFKSFLSFPCFGMQVITPSKAIFDSCPEVMASLMYLKIQNCNSLMKYLKNSFEYPSGPGALFSLLLLMVFINSSRLYGASSLVFSKSDSRDIF